MGLGKGSLRGRRFRKKETFSPFLKAMLHGAIFLATCNAILLLRDVRDRSLFIP